MTSSFNEFPGARYHPKHGLVTFHPVGVLDDAMADQMTEFIGVQEKTLGESFNRYTDFTGVTDFRVKVGHVFQIAEHRRAVEQSQPSLKSAFYSDRLIGFGMARMYQSLMEGSVIEVRAFKVRAEAADWLAVPEDLLLPPDLDSVGED